MAQDFPCIPVDTLASFMRDVFIGSGVPAEDAAICAEVLITSDRRGIESHGIGRLKLYYDRIRKGIQQPITKFEIVRESPATAVVDGHHGMGQVIGYRSMELAINKAKQYGMGSVAVRNSTHFGIAGYYPLMAVKAGMIGMAFTNARPSIAPTFSVQPMLGTNPIAFGAPTDEDCPFLYDAATSITQRGKFEVYARLGKPAKPGWAINSQGESITDAEQVLQGFAKDAAALLPLGGAGEDLAGYKGYGLATIVEILSASLQQGKFLWDLSGIAADGKTQPNYLGHFFMAINVEAFCSLEDFKHSTGEIVRQLRAARKAPGAERIFSAGEKEFIKEKETAVRGIAIVPSLQKDMLEMKQALHLDQYSFPF
ncbi:MAG: Ldh family oxidoreductase [Leptolinea sp.]|jgi:LDH2 family malate/lactate/ureidoglycolate dehydrogenase|nr:Ldh family oxidoreductase [Leptolinea sp.]